MHYALEFIKTPAGQKLADKANMEVETGNNPGLEVYAKTAFGIQVYDVKSSGSMSGEVTPDERGYAAPVANTPVVLPEPESELEVESDG
jgi:hypothetical protein